MYKVLKYGEFINERHSSVYDESIKYKDKSFVDMVKGFKGLGYRFAGTYSFSTKYSGAERSEGIDKVLNYYCDLRNSIFGIKKYNDFEDLDVYVSEDKYAPMSDDECNDTVYNPENIEKVVKFKDGYCFWEEKLKYFYFIKLSKYDDHRQKTIGYFEKWMEIKTSTQEEIEAPLMREKEIEDANTSRDNEKQRMKKEEKDAMEEIERIEETIFEDYQENKSKYKFVESLPENVRKDLNEKNAVKKLQGTYFEHVVEKGASNQYDESEDTFAVNNRELTDGYIYKAIVNHAKPKAYWGD